jgi:surface protein
MKTCAKSTTEHEKLPKFLPFICTIIFCALFSLTLNSSTFQINCAYGAENTNAMYRLYNPNSGEHFYTADFIEHANLVGAGWKDEGVGWYSPAKSKTPVYRLYNPYVKNGDHHYTTSSTERNNLKKAGWKDEGIGWYSDDNKGVPIYRQYNPNAKTGTHNYTTSKSENDKLIKAGWKSEGIAFYGVKNTVYAVLSETDGSLRFYNRKQIPQVGDTWDDGSGNKRKVSKIYDQIILDKFSEPDWKNDSTAIRSVTFVDSGISPTDMGYWFCYLTNLKTADLSKLDSSKLTGLDCLFAQCKQLTKVDLSTLNTSKVISFYGMFADCENLQHVYVGKNWKVNNPTSHYGVFYNCKKLPNWNSAYTDGTKAYAGVGGYLELKS